MMENKKIAFYIGDLGRGGAERVISNLANYFHRRGWIVVMVTKLKEEEEYPLDAGIERIIADITPGETGKSRIANLFRRIQKLKNIWRDVRPDIIISFIRKNNLMALASATPLGIPVVVSVRSAPERELGGIIGPISRFMFRRAAGIVLQTGGALEYFPPVLQKKACILPNSLEPEFIRLSRTLGEYNDRQHRIILVGRIDDNKNQILAVRAFDDIIREGFAGDWTMELYGDGSGRRSIEEYISENNMAGRIICHGRVNNVQEKMKQASIFILTSKVEGMPNALLEAMTMGLACISSDCPCGGPREVIEDGVNGFLIAVDDRAQLHDRLLELINDGEKRKTFSENAIKISERLNPERVNRQWMDYVGKILDE